MPWRPSATQLDEIWQSVSASPEAAADQKHHGGYFQQAHLHGGTAGSVDSRQQSGHALG
jgi:hypothetical protein